MRLVYLLLLLILPSMMVAQDRLFTVLEYNVENLYDTLHDAGKDDYEFLPDGKLRWTRGRYWKKLGRMAIVIAAAGYPSPPDLVGLCEVENDSVLYDLTKRTRLRQFGYEYLMTNSSDPRGIDVALIYHPMRFHPLRHESLSIPPPSLKHKATRDVLYVVGQVPTGDTLHVFLCHFPSRSGGKMLTEKYRCVAARIVREYCDSILEKNPCANILLMGDFNDEPNDVSLSKELRVKVPDLVTTLGEKELYILSKGLNKSDGVRGTYKLKGEWSQIDHFIVSGHLLNNTSLFRTTPQHCQIFCPEFLMERDKKDGTIKPKRTYLGTFYKGGYSDHFPLRLQFLF